MKKINCYRSTVIVFFLTLLATHVSSYTEKPLTFNYTELTDSNPDSQWENVDLPGFDNAQLLARDANLRQYVNAPPVLKYAEPIAVSISPQDRWQVLDKAKHDGVEMSVWRTRITSPGALSLNLGFSDFYMPKGGALFVYTPDRKHIIRPFTAMDNEEHGQLWTPMLPGDSVVVEVNVPTHKLAFLRVHLSSVNHGYLGSSVAGILEQVKLKSGSCNVDVMCPEGALWQNQINSVAAISTGGSLFCTGSALNNTMNDGKGFFLTANHCGIDVNNAASLVTYWNYQNSYCRTPGSGDSGGPGDGSLNDFNTGAIFRASYSPSDFTLVELDDPFDPDHNVYLSGWNAGPEMAISAVAIHHPNVDEKRISFENDPVTRTAYGSSTPDANGTHVRVIDWDHGTTEPGSSGSPLFDQNQRVIGQLHGGGAACGNDLSDWYGALAVSWNGGGTNNTGMSHWLDSANTGELAIDGRVADDGSGPYAPNASVNYSCDLKACSFDGSGSTDRDGEIVNYAWTFGDGTNGTGVSPSHTYVDSGNYSVTLTVTDNDDLTDTITRTVYVSSGDSSGSNLDITLEPKQWFIHAITIPSGTVRLTVNTNGGNGDADLYVRFGLEPNTSEYNCRSWTTTSTESCVINNPTPGVWYVGVHAYSAISSVDEQWIYE
ncbi:PKD domain-containing protein [Microbulbifer sp. 2205BS26-8]|uniref:PKD domain-containing protein n=1 Tax=Microbulbifer sp. 2205BS26-8 TaxID=3064386 RepID=UPI00273DD667|nr:PKD domain-containing protein [Microbulbifer sp. 2205BS26-8]MDP5211116.1 PKD domain-containing protein [Microbulbifer sp. 2205BS26-8]